MKSSNDTLQAFFHGVNGFPSLPLWLESLTFPFLLVLENEEIAYANKQASTLLALPSHSLGPLFLRDAIAETTPWQTWWLQMKNKQPVFYETVGIRTTSGLLDIALQASHLSIDANKEVALVLLTDISIQKTKEKALAQRSTLLDEIMNNTSEAIFIINSQNNEIIDCNYRALELFDCSNREQLVGTKGNSLGKHPYSTEQLNAIIQELAQTGRWTSEMEYISKKGREFWGWIEGTLILVGKEQPDYLVRISDIDQKKKAEQQLIINQKRYEDLIHYNQSLLCTHSLDGTILSVNPASLKSLGYDQEKELLGQNLSILFEEKNLPYYQGYMLKMQHIGEANGIMKVLNRHGKTMYWLFHNYKVDDVETASYVVGSALDITDRILAEKELKKAKTVAEESLKARDLFFANMSHEIRTPLHGILGVNALLGKTTLDEQQTHYTGIIHQSADHLLRLINDILDLAKMESGKVELEAIPFDMSDSLHRTLEPFKIVAQEKNLGINIQFPTKPLPTLVGDPYRLSQIVTNLVNNALKFTKKGSVNIGVERLSETNHSITLAINVSDTGIGMSEETIAQLFNAYSQANTSHTRLYGGTGLGLSICSHLVEAHKGTISCSSQIGKGSTFRCEFTYPKSSHEPKAPLSNQEIDNQCFKHLRILLVEDNPVNQLICQYLLQQKQINVDIASRGADVLPLVLAHTYDIILMDIYLPDIGGEEITQQIRSLANKAKAAVPIIALTANALKGDSEKYLQAGMDGYLSKPYTEHELLSSIVDMLHLPVRVTHKKNNLPSSTHILADTLYDLSFLNQDSPTYPEKANAFLHTCLSSFTKQLNGLQNAIKENNAAEAAFIVHAIKPSAALLNNASLLTCIPQLEAAFARKQSLSTLVEVMHLFLTTLQAITDAMKRELGID